MAAYSEQPATRADLPCDAREEIERLAQEVAALKALLAENLPLIAQAMRDGEGRKHTARRLRRLRKAGTGGSAQLTRLADLHQRRTG